MADRRRTGESPDDRAHANRPETAHTPHPEKPAARPSASAPGRESAQRRALASAPSPDSLAESAAERDRRIRRARFLAELAEARELRKRVAPRRARAAELHMRVLRTFRY